MKKNLLLITVFLIATYWCKGQYNFVVPVTNPMPLSCEVNANDRSDQNFRNDIKRASFKYHLNNQGTGFDCSGTLINRNTSQGDLGQYFISAWHCFMSNKSGCGGTPLDFANVPIEMTFNYQSPPNNSGMVFADNATGSVYKITRYIRLVDHVDCAYGDFALCQILGDPIPSYFNVYYAGWYPTDLLVTQDGPFASVNHPAGNIKKMAGTPIIINNSGGVISTACKTVTKLIDFLFGWIWGHRWSTQVVCTYLDVPYAGTRYTLASPLAFGRLEDGASGSGLFTGGGLAGANRHIGQLSGSVGITSCTVDAAAYEFGKLTDSYYRQTVKNTMNPPNSYWTDQNGIPGRQISCYPQINLSPGQFDPSYDLYPANLYQADNQIILTAQSTFTAGGSAYGNVTVKNGANFVFQAGQSVTLNPGFQTEPGANFQATVISACSIDGVASYNAPPSHAIPNKLYDSTRADSLQLIPQKKFDINKYLGTGAEQSGNVTKFNVYPNPTTGIVNMELFLKAQEPSLVMTLYDLYGRAVFTKNFKNVYFIQEQLTLPSLPAGMYNLTVRSASNIYSKKIVLMH